MARERVPPQKNRQNGNTPLGFSGGGGMCFFSSRKCHEGFGENPSTFFLGGGGEERDPQADALETTHV